MKGKTETHRFRLAVSAMAATFRQEATDALFEGYRLGLEGLAIDAIERAVKAAIQTCRFMPSAAELRELAGDMLPADRAMKAWAIVAQASRKGAGPSLDFDDPAINATVRNLGGWETFLATWDAEQTTWVRKKFEQVYQSMCRSGFSASDGSRLIGFNERKTIADGYQDFRGYRDGKLVGPDEPRTWWPPKPLVIECHLPPLPIAIEGPGKHDEGIAMLELLNDVGQMPGGADRRFQET